MCVLRKQQINSSAHESLSRQTLSGFQLYPKLDHIDLFDSYDF